MTEVITFLVVIYIAMFIVSWVLLWLDYRRIFSKKLTREDVANIALFSAMGPVSVALAIYVTAEHIVEQIKRKRRRQYR
jgi:NhaP-type Na+/H+ or K+/H+ antiporter